MREDQIFYKVDMKKIAYFESYLILDHAQLLKTLSKIDFLMNVSDFHFVQSLIGCESMSGPLITHDLLIPANPNFYNRSTMHEFDCPRPTSLIEHQKVIL